MVRAQAGATIGEAKRLRLRRPRGGVPGGAPAEREHARVMRINR